MTNPRATKVQQALKMEQVPPEKWPKMVQRTILGALFIALGVVGLQKGWDVHWVIGACVFGASVWSTQLVTHALLALVTPFKAFLGAWRKKDDA